METPLNIILTSIGRKLAAEASVLMLRMQEQ